MPRLPKSFRARDGIASRVRQTRRAQGMLEATP
jgi:hypothetical protein